MRCWILLLLLQLLLPRAAWADPWDNTTAAYFSEPSAKVAPLPYAVPPHTKCGAHNCPLMYLRVAAAMHEQGTADLLFNVKADGKVAGVIVSASSTIDDLDLMSTICVSKWQYEAANENDAPVEVSWRAHIAWTQNGKKPNRDIPQIRLPALNCMRTRSGAMAQAAPEKPTAVRYQLLNGEVTTAAVESSSGDAPLDEHFAQCVKSWHFDPVMANGAPATGSYTAVIYWRQAL